MKIRYAVLALALIWASGLCPAGPARPVRSTLFQQQSPAGPPIDPPASEGQWFVDLNSGIQTPRTWELHDDDNTYCIQGVVQSITYDGTPAMNIVAFDVLATVSNMLTAIPPLGTASNSHQEAQQPSLGPSPGTMVQTLLVAEFAVADMRLLPSGQPPSYTDPLSAGTYFIEAVNEDAWAWYCWTPGDPVHQAAGSYQVPAWRLGDIPPGQSRSVRMLFNVSGPGLPMTDYRHSVVRASQQQGLDVLYNRHTSLKISHWLDTLLVDYGSVITAPPGVYQEPPPEVIHASDASVFFDLEMDYGDAPDPGYPTLLVNNGARHVLVPGVHLGKTVDNEPDGQPHPRAMGDDLNAVPDEDGVLFNTSLVRGTSANLTVSCSVPGFLSAWVDFNQDGIWANPAERVFGILSLPAGSSQVSFSVPVSASLGSTMARFRFTTRQTPLLPTGLAEDGEVEDYEVDILSEQDFGDAPPPYPVLLTNDGARHNVPSGFWLGAVPPDAEGDGQPHPQAQGDDLALQPDEDGVAFPAPLRRGATSPCLVTVSTNGTLNAWIDFSRSGAWGDVSGEQVFTDLSLIAGTNHLGIAVPSDATLGPTFARFRFSSQTGLAPVGLASDGEVEDYPVTVYQSAPTNTVTVTNLTTTTGAVTVEWNGEPHVLYRTEYADALSSNTLWTVWGAEVTSPPYAQTNSISSQTQRVYRVIAPFTTP